MAHLKPAESFCTTGLLRWFAIAPALKALPRPRFGLASFKKAHIQTVAAPAQILTSYVLRSNLLQQQMLVQNGTTAAFRNRRARGALVVAP